MDTSAIETMQAYFLTFTSDTGQRVLADLIRSIGDRPSYDRGDPYHTAYNEGARSVVLKIRALIECGRDPAVLLQKYNQEEQDERGDSDPEPGSRNAFLDADSGV